MFAFASAWRPRHAARCLVLFLGLGLAGCQQNEPGGEGASGGSGASQDFSRIRPGPSGGLSDFEALGRYFVTSFEAFEATAGRLRTADPRYRLQRNRWQFSGGATSYDSYPLAAARVEYAHAAGLTGTGQVVAVLDAGFRTTHEAFAGRDLSFPVGLPVDDHGTAVASILAGSSARMIGVAPGAALALGSFQSHATRAAATREAIRLDAVAQNNSWGFEVDVSSAAFDAVFSTGQAYLAALDDYARQGVVVFAVSNNNARARSSLMEALPALRPELEPGWLAVANAVPSFDAARVTSARLVSAGCLDAARWCLTADGGWIAARAGADAAYGFDTGSSFAAPQVAGALALLAEAFPDLTPHQLRLRLLASADNGFFTHDGAVELAPGFVHGYSRTFGQGFLDLRAALLPIGTPVVPAEGGGSTVAGRPIYLAGAATGDAVERALSVRDVLVVDGLGADFRMGAGALVARPVPQPLVRQRLATLAREEGTEPSATWSGTDLIDRLPVARVALGRPEDAVAVEVLVPREEGDAEAFGLGLRGRLEAPGAALQLGAHVLRDTTGGTGLSDLDGDTARARATYSALLGVEAQANLSPAAALTAFAQVGLSGTEYDAARFGQNTLTGSGEFRRKRSGVNLTGRI